MEKSNNLYDLFLHMQWADGEVWKAVLETAEAESDEKIKGLFVHLHMTQHGYLSLWKKTQLSFPDVKDFKDLKAVEDWGKEFYQGVYSYLDSLSEPDLNAELKIPWVKFFEERMGKSAGPTTISESLLQVALHSAYHRGQINSRIRALGGEPPLVDYIFWLMQSRPAANW